jgi:hypothetical protein
LLGLKEGGNIMKSAPKRVLLACAVLIIAILGGFWAFGYHTFEFNGGIGISDNGFFSYPRYRAQLGELPLWKSSDYLFTVHGLPPGPLDLALQVRDATYANRAELTSLPTLISVAIVDNDGKQICSVSGSLSDAKDRDHSGWVLASSDASASFWQLSCQQLPISRFKTYTIKVALVGADDHSPHKMLVAVLQGGGNELP